MKTTTIKIENDNKKWFIIDADGKILGKVAVRVADKLRGKDKPTFSPHLDNGDFVVIINAEKIKLSGNKKDQKVYYSHSGYPGGLKEKPYKKMLDETPEKILEKAINGMLPKNRLRKVFMKKLKIYKGEEHPHEAQSPITLEV